MRIYINTNQPNKPIDPVLTCPKCGGIGAKTTNPYEDSEYFCFICDNFFIIPKFQIVPVSDTSPTAGGYYQ